MSSYTENLRRIMREMKDPCVLCEIYPADAVPNDDGFDPQDALKRYAAINDLDESKGNVGFYGASYTRLVKRFGSAKRSITAEVNQASVDFSNLSNEISEFELDREGGKTGFEGLILVIRLISRSMSVLLSDSKIVFVGRCDQPKSGTRESLSVSAKDVLASLDCVLPRRKFAPEDILGRHPSDPLYEGFRFMPQYGAVSYSVREKRGGLLGFLGFKKTVTKTLPWSSFSDLDAEKYLPEACGRVQMIFTHIGYADIGTFIRMTSAACEGEIEGYFNVRSVSPGFSLTPSFEAKLGKVGILNGEANPAWVAPGIYSRTANILCEVSGSQVQTTDPAPDIVGGILAKKMMTPNASGEWAIYKWSDDGAAQTRFYITSEDYGKLAAAWLDDEWFFEAFKFNNEFIFDSSDSDLLFVPDMPRYKGEGEEDEYGNPDDGLASFFRSTAAVTPEYLEHLAGEKSVSETFLLNPRVETYSTSEDDLRAPIEPADPTDPGPGGGTEPTLPSLAFYLRRRYTSNFVITEEIKLADLLEEVIFPASRLYKTMGANGKIKIKNKKPVDWALGTAQFSAFGNEIALDDVSKFLANQSGSLLIDPHTAQSEVRQIASANYSAAQNSVLLSASDNITVSAFAGCDGAGVPAQASLTVDETADENSFALDGIEIFFNASEADTEETIAGFIYGTVNAHPTLRRKFAAFWEPGTFVVTIKAKFGSVQLNSVLEFDHSAPIGNPSAPPEVTAHNESITADNILPAGIYKIAYAFANERGQTVLSPYSAVEIGENQNINVSEVAPPAGFDVCWYVSPAAGSRQVRFYKRNDGAEFLIDSLPRLSAAVPPDLNRTGAEVMRVSAVFSDRAEDRSNISESNVLEASFKWILGTREKNSNSFEITFRDSTQDWRLSRITLLDENIIDKTRKISPTKINGQAIDSYHQAYRIISGIKAEQRDAGFFYEWAADREALLLEEGEVVCITDAGSGAINLPVRIEAIEYALDGFPKATFTARKYATTLYDDSVAERQIPVIVESGSLQARAADTVEYAVTNLTESRTFDANTATAAELADALGTLIADLKNNKRIGD